MSKKRNKQVKVDPTFALALEDISLERIKRGLDRDKQGARRITLAMVRSSNFKKLKDDVISREFMTDE